MGVTTAHAMPIATRAGKFGSLSFIAPSSAPPVVRLRSVSSHLPSKHELITGARKAELFVITATMAVIDVEDRVLLAVISSAGVAVLTCGVYVQARYDERSPSVSLMCAAPILVAASALLVVLRAFSKTVEGMDVYAQKYAQLRETELGDRKDDDDRDGDADKTRRVAWGAAAAAAVAATTAAAAAAAIHSSRGRLRQRAGGKR